MKIFISWSGEASREIGEAFRNWLPDVLQFVQPYFTPSDIEKGQRWSAEIASNLEASKFGLIVITAENLLAPWLMFEAGAISKSTEASRVCPLLFGIDASQLTGPLLQFQATPFSKDEVFKFVVSLNALGQPAGLSEQHLLRSFERCWPELEGRVQAVLTRPATKQQKGHIRSTQDMVEETLNLVRSIAGKPENEETMNHWIVMFNTSLDYAEDSLKISERADQIAQVEQLNRLVSYLRTVLNLIAPKIAKAKAFGPLSDKATVLLKKIEIRKKEIEASIVDDDIPF